MGIVYYALLGIIPTVLFLAIAGAVFLLSKKSPDFNKWWYSVVDGYRSKPRAFQSFVKILFYAVFLYVGYEIVKRIG